MAEKCDLCLWNQGSGGGGGGGSSTLSGLTDVDISNPSDGQTLVYNATSGKWENGSGGGLLVTINESDNGDYMVYTADKTVREILTGVEKGQVMFRRINTDSADYTETLFGSLVSIERSAEDNPTTYGFYLRGLSQNDEFIPNNMTLVGAIDDYPTTNYDPGVDE